jgi:hypothetical protein
MDRWTDVNRWTDMNMWTDVNRWIDVNGWTDINRWTDVNTDRLMWNRFTELKQKTNVRIKQSQD